MVLGKRSIFFGNKLTMMFSRFMKIVVTCKDKWNYYGRHYIYNDVTYSKCFATTVNRHVWSLNQEVKHC